MKKAYAFLSLIGLITIFANVLDFPPLQASTQAIKIGVTSGPHAMIFEHIQQQAKKEGLEIEIIEFNDFILPNAALDNEEIQINSYQHQPFLEEQVSSRGYKIESIAKTVLMPMGIYSKKVKDIKEFSQGAKIAIPNDPTNSGRALLLLQKAGLITLKQTKNPTLLDIQTNPKKLEIIELEAPQLPRSLDDLDAAVINTDWIVLAKMDAQTAIYKESSDSPYTNILAVKKGRENLPEIRRVIALYQSNDTRQFIEKTFKGAVIPGW